MAIQGGGDPFTLLGSTIYGIGNALLNPSRGFVNIRRFLADVVAAGRQLPPPAAPTVSELGTLNQSFVGVPPASVPDVVWRPPSTVPRTPTPAPSPVPRPAPAVDPRIVSPAVRVLGRVLGLPFLIFFPSRTADDDTVPEGYPYPEPMPEPVPKGPPRRPVIRPDTAPAWPAPDWWNNPRPREPKKRPRWRPRPTEEPNPYAIPSRELPWPAPIPRPTPAPTRPAPGTRPMPRAPVAPQIWPVPVMRPTPRPTPRPTTPRPIPFNPLQPMIPTPTPTPTPGRITDILTPGSPGLTPLQASPLGSPQAPARTGRCPPCEQVKRRRKRKGQCRQGYFREYPDRTEFITWSRRKCQ